LARQWRILRVLTGARSGRAVSDLARELECHPRTVYRDLEALQMAGFPIYNQTAQGQHVWAMLDTAVHPKPVPFSLSELTALYVSVGMARVSEDAVFCNELKALLHKISTLLPPESVAYLQRLQQTFHVGARPHKPYGRFKEILQQLNEAAVNKRTVEMVYFTMSRGQATRRRVDPYKIWFFDGSFYLAAHCHLRGEVRLFAVDRIREMRQTAESFQIPADFCMEDFMGPSFGVFRGERQKVRLWFAADAAGYIREKTWHPSQKVVQNDDGSLIFEAEVAGTEEIKFWILSWGSRVRVMEPESLKRQIAAEAAAVVKGYGNQGGVK